MLHVDKADGRLPSHKKLLLRMAQLSCAGQHMPNAYVFSESTDDSCEPGRLDVSLHDMHAGVAYIA